MIRAGWTYSVGLFWTFRVSLMVIVRAALRMPSLESYQQEGPTRWGAAILRAAKVRVVWKDAHRLRPRAQILVANHQSWFDIFVLAGTLPVKYSFVGKKELASIPGFGAAWRRVGHYAIDRGDNKAAATALREVGERIAADTATVVMFPEGTRSESERMAKFKTGAFLLAIKAQVPVVPVALAGTHPIMPKGRWAIRPGVVRVHVGEPISTAGLLRRDRHDLARRAHDAVEELLRHGDAASLREPLEAQGGSPPPDAAKQVVPCAGDPRPETELSPAGGH